MAAWLGLIFIFVIATKIFGEIVERHYYRDPNKIQASGSSVPKRSKIECAVACSQDCSCKSHSFKNGTCWLSDSEQNEYSENEPIDCPAEYTYDNGTEVCYLVVVDGNRVYDGAAAACEEHNGILIRIRSVEIWEMVRSRLVADYSLNDVWINGRQDQPSSWKYTDGTDATYFNWSPGEPSDGSGDFCLEMYGGGYNFFMCNKTCSDNKPGFVCEYIS